LKFQLQEEKMNFIRFSSSRSEVEKLADTIKNNNEQETLRIDQKEETARNFVSSTNCFSSFGYSVMSPKSTFVSSKLQIYKSEDLSKIITSANIILNEKLQQLIEINNYLIAKSSELKTYPTLQPVKITIKKQSNLSKEIIEDIVNEVSYIKCTWEESHLVFILMQEMLKEIFEVKFKYKNFSKSIKYLNFLIFRHGINQET
jgi:hypothetical protein